MSTSAVPPETNPELIAKEEDFTKLPSELTHIDWTKPIAWGKHQPYPPSDDATEGDKQSSAATATTAPAPPLPLTPEGTLPSFKQPYPALEFHVHATCGRARYTTVHLPHGPVATPVFMPVGTKGTLKGLSPMDVTNSDALNNQIILANTYHLALQPGTELIRDAGGLHTFMNWDRNILTDSGGFQMVSLLKLAEITEEGVTFENPFQSDNDTHDDAEASSESEYGDDDDDEVNNNRRKRTRQESAQSGKKSQRMLLRPEDSIYHQNNIGSDIIMALDDVVSSVADDKTRFEIATYRTLRWLDRCHAAHRRTDDQNLFPIVQGGLDTRRGGLRDVCLAGFRLRDKKAPGYAIGGLAGGESKDDFWKVVDHCCRALPDTKPRYLMGVGYPLDLVVCTGLGVDMYDCVYPTRTARFGVALIDGEAPGTLRLKSHRCSDDYRVMMNGCKCMACSEGYTISRLHAMLKNNNPLAVSLVTHHNLAYMMALNKRMRDAIKNNAYGDFARDFIRHQYRGKENGGQDVPNWVKEATSAAGISLDC
jgi:queuine tRNA-ribosyltransferase